ncbi:hypothetical protein [Mycoplasma sp. 'Moose RK']|uniref:hypothetical protein n=1 Tax=Mycoplasma sp. 'Moose RK' TaxID=2780095 RepID=UPI0018C2447C|nr:hypothetical protein [Mycoplasma sp. 'Moose RK']MBG0730767.1 hypothetical protein [Mycoplasma sp. 'Moose RK']
MVILKLKKVLGFSLVSLVPLTFFTYTNVQNNHNNITQSLKPQMFSYYKNYDNNKENILRKIQKLNRNNNNFKSFFSLSKENNVGYEYKHKVLKIEQGELEILIAGFKKIVYFGGLFWQDKAAWVGVSEIKYDKKNNWSYYHNPKPENINLTTRAWISGLASPSFEINGEAKYNSGNKESFSAGLRISTKIDFNTKELVDTFEKKNTNRLVMNYQGTGWNYKIFDFGQYATGLLIDDYEYSSIATNNPLIPDKEDGYTLLPYTSEDESVF